MLKMNYEPITKLMVVAHPDDEIIFGGYQLLEPGWKIICVTNANNHVRSLEFNRVMTSLNCDFEIWDYKDRFHEPLPDEIADRLSCAVTRRPYQKVVTHNLNGEYGHPHHIQIHHILTKLQLPLWVFDEGEPSKLWSRKLELLKIYQSQETVWSKFLSRAERETIRKWDDRE